MVGKRQTGSDGVVEGGGVRVSGGRVLAEVRQTWSDGVVEAGRELGGLGERGSPQCCNPVNAAHSPDWRHSPHHREESGVCR